MRMKKRRKRLCSGHGLAVTVANKQSVNMARIGHVLVKERKGLLIDRLKSLRLLSRLMFISVVLERIVN